MENITEEKKKNIDQLNTEPVVSNPAVPMQSVPGPAVPGPAMPSPTVPEIKEAEELPPPEENMENGPKDASQILDEEERELPVPVSTEVKFPSYKSKKPSKPKTKKCPKGCIKKTRCKGTIRGGRRSKKNKKSSKNKSKKNKKAKKRK
jgi:hypothetical protein